MYDPRMPGSAIDLQSSSFPEPISPKLSHGTRSMSHDLQEAEPQTFVETALKLGGKSEEEARRTGSLDRADDQVEALFAERYQTSRSPAHRAVWDHQFPAELFSPQPPK